MNNNNVEHSKNLLIAICTLQEQKEAVYGVDWKRFGFVSSLFNVFRKFIRLRTMWYAGWQPSKDDSRLDTVIDLLNYLILCVLLHAARTPRAFAIFLSGFEGAKQLTPDYFEANECGFKRFCSEVLEPDMATRISQPNELARLMPKIISMGENTVEAWLTRVATLAERSGRLRELVASMGTQTAQAATVPPVVQEWLEQLSRALGTTSRPGDGTIQPSGEEDDPYLRLMNIYDMILLCVEVALRQGADAPDEWQRLMTTYGPKH